MNSGLHRIGRIAALVAAALSVAGVQEDADIARWIDDLAHEEVPESFRVGPFTVTYDFPEISITSAEEIPDRLFGTARLEGRYKEGRGPLPGESGARFRLDDLKDTKDPEIWCDCPSGPKPEIVKEPRTRKISVETSFEYRNKKPSDFQSMKILFNKRIEEPCEAEAVVPPE